LHMSSRISFGALFPPVHLCCAYVCCWTLMQQGPGPRVFVIIAVHLSTRRSLGTSCVCCCRRSEEGMKIAPRGISHHQVRIQTA
jgi:hypothetical protein